MYVDAETLLRGCRLSCRALREAATADAIWKFKDGGFVPTHWRHQRVWTWFLLYWSRRQQIELTNLHNAEDERRVMNVPEGLLQREAARQAAVEARRAERPGTADVFWSDLNDAMGVIRESLRAEVGAGEEGRPDRIRGLVEATRGLSERIRQMAPSLSAYDIHRAQREVAALEQTVRGYKARLLPRQPFSFERARQAQPINVEAQPDDTPVAAPEAVAAVVAQQRNVNLRLDNAALDSNFVHLEHYADSTICIASDHVFALKLSHLSNCTVSCLPVQGSVFVEFCHGCTFTIAGAQLRVHDSTECRFNLYVHSDPIIEDSTELVFSGDYDVVVPDPSWPANRWQHVKDFNMPIQGSSRNVAFIQ